ncbi:PAS domain S-box protein [Sphingomonas sp. TZW2008]|uniref:PAS domain S-box protein n=1 Tax=Sphingomonas sp. TZW2008 TaxID=1917973 RepID=UPI000A26C27A|nr:PAS domain S-box protein [Sphingomonas sp. TZW2008]
MRSVQRYLVTTSLFLVALVLAAATFIAFEVERVGRRQAEQQLQATTRALSLVVDGDLKRYEAILRVLAMSPHVAQRDWSGLDLQARRILQEPDAWLVVSDRAGRQLVNTGLSRGAQLPPGKAPEDMWGELDQGRSRICNLASGRVERQILCVDIAAPSRGRPEIALSVIMRPTRLAKILEQQRVEQGTYANVVDRRGIIAWRNVRPDQFIGQLATPDIRAAMSRRAEGVQESHSLEGVPTVAAFSRSPYSGWTFVVGVPRSDIRAGANQAVPLALGAAAFLILTGAAVGLLTARRVTRAAKNLAETAGEIERGFAPKYRPTGLKEIDTAAETLQAAFQARKLSEDRYRLIFEQSSDLILTADLNQVITDCNQSAAVAVGVRREQAIGRNIAEFISPDDFTQTSDKLRQKLAAGGTTRYDVRVRDS